MREPGANVNAACRGGRTTSTGVPLESGRDPADPPHQRRRHRRSRHRRAAPRPGRPRRRHDHRSRPQHERGGARHHHPPRALAAAARLRRRLPRARLRRHPVGLRAHRAARPALPGPRPRRVRGQRGRQHGRRRHVLGHRRRRLRGRRCAATPRVAFSVEELRARLARRGGAHPEGDGRPRDRARPAAPQHPERQSAGPAARRHRRASARRDSAAPAPTTTSRSPGTTAVPREHYLPCEHPASGDWVDTDFDVVASGAVAVTPLRYDLLDPGLLADLAQWDLDLERLRG